jgi:ubiquinone/menaquinone biosynthesis C-methylase UbiE
MERDTMTPLDTTGPNAEQIRYWTETAGPKWVRMEALLEAQIAPFGAAAMDRAALISGERVLDVGCGCGATSFELARRVGTEGLVLGVDISEPMLGRARERAAGSEMATVRFALADAQTHRFARDTFDALFSRFGVMFFTDPGAAFTNLRAALRPGGRLAFVCWQSLQQNPWMLLPLMAAAQHIALPPPPAPGEPGPFSFADAERVRAILARAGFADVALEPLEMTLSVGGGGALEQAVEFLLEMGPAGAALREAGPAARPAVAAAVREVLAPFATPEAVRMASAAWIVTARASTATPTAV